MLGTNQGSPSYDDQPSNIFAEVRFVLLGFNPIKKNQILSTLVDGGGVDVGQYGPSCTHVIVDNIVYDDPICVAAQRDGKTVITSLWVADSFDVGMFVDPTNIMYRPLKDLNGIPGAKSLVICLTGYQRQDREDIMTMVGLMGANFSKPLVASKVTHLICYKFEGEKYELAKKMKEIKLVNQRWLEDCLSAWEILPEASYNKSGYELEMMEAEAKDSEEADDPISKPSGGGTTSSHQPQISNQDISRYLSATSASKGLPETVNTHNLVSVTRKETICDQRPNMNENHSKLAGTITPVRVGASGSAKRSPSSGTAKLSTKSYSRKTCSPVINKSPSLPQQPETSKQEFSRDLFSSGAFNGLSDVGNANDMISATRKETVSDKTPVMYKSGNRHPEVLGARDTGTLGDATCVEPAKSYEITPEKVKSDFPSTSGSAKRSPRSCATNLGTKSYSRKTPRKTTPPMVSGENLSKLNNASTVIIGEINGTNDVNICSTMKEQAKEGTKFGSVQTTELRPDEEQTGTLPEKRKLGVSGGRSKLQKRSRDPKAHNLEGSLMTNRTDFLEPVFTMSGPVEINNLVSSGNDTHYLTETAAMDPAKNIHTNISTTMSSEMRQDENVEALQFCLKGSRKASWSRSDGIGISESAIGRAPEPENELQDVEAPSLGTKKFKVEKVKGFADIDTLAGVNADGQSKPLRRKMFAKKSLGSKQGLGNVNTTNQKGSIYLHNLASRDDAVTSSLRAEEAAEMVSPKAKVDIVLGFETNKVSESGNEAEGNSVLMDDETEAPDDKDEHGFDAAVVEMKYGEDEPDNAREMATGGNLGVQLITTKTDGLGLLDNVMTSTDENDGSEPKKAVSRKNTNLGDPTHRENATKEKITRGKKRPLSKIKKSVACPMKITNSKELSDKENDNEKTEKKKGKAKSQLAGKTKRTLPPNKLENHMEVEEEKSPICLGDQNVTPGKKQVGKVASNKTPREINLKTGKSDLDSVHRGRVSTPDPVCFIVSGHRLQRKEFQQVIKCLKGRVCRDSHNWSYQATHFIVPDPIRRTEKFFAAAASGRWILKTDYLTASNEAGRFLAEEPYEWHNRGLTEDGTINLEAPRKWRLLRERTGHGAFYGMRIIIYGDCIAPPLDTLKRVVKAGDGTILATSPPYSRFLGSGVDYAIVSPGMPRIDVWVQEFLRHEIPCVVPDYLVEYVCKTGYSLERHIQYNTHAWVEKSLKNLENRLEEVDGEMELTPPENSSDDKDDLPCQVCGSLDRAEEMLICGDESGSTGCGVGTHIDCCDPPFQDIPEEDWFCPKCSEEIKNRKNPRKSSKKRASASKKK